MACGVHAFSGTSLNAYMTIWVNTLMSGRARCEGRIGQSHTFRHTSLVDLQLNYLLHTSYRLAPGRGTGKNPGLRHDSGKLLKIRLGKRYEVHRIVSMYPRA